MRKKLLLFATILLLSCALPALAAQQGQKLIRVGLAYGAGALPSANLQNNSGYGSGFRFGFYDERLAFVELGRTEESEITMLRASQMYRTDSGYSLDPPAQPLETLGCYHVLMAHMEDFPSVREAAAALEGGFAAWSAGEYQLRQGAYETAEEAEAAREELGGLEVVGSSVYAVNVVRTGTFRLLFQFDGGSALPLGVMPDTTGAEQVRCWFKGFRYGGGFRYERLGGGNLTVVNIVDMEQYVKGVIPYEMNNAWPLEALKAQAICARSYAWNNISDSRHSAAHFDLCTTEDCQVYHGYGGSSAAYQANARTDQAVEETAGQYGLCDGAPIVAYYSSSHGGGSERIDNVWNAKFLPYLCGVLDPYEHLVDRINPKASWTERCSAQVLTARLQARGYGLDTSVRALSLRYSPTGNVIQVQVSYENGRSNTFTPKMSWGVRSLFGVSSLHFTVTAQHSAPEQAEDEAALHTALGRGTVSVDSRVRVISGSGTRSERKLGGSSVLHADGSLGTLTSGSTGGLITAEGGDPAPTPESLVGQTVTVSGDTYVITGGGNGHQLGMSQYGAYAMAQEGFSGAEIVAFYFPGVTVGRF